MRRIEYLSVIGSIAPMVGLLGTATGMIFAFQQVASARGAAGAGDDSRRIDRGYSVAGDFCGVPKSGLAATLVV